MSGEHVHGRWRPRALVMVATVFGVAFALAFAVSAKSVADSSGSNNLPIDPTWLAAQLQSATNSGQFTNHVLPGADAARDANDASCPRTQANGYSRHCTGTTRSALALAWRIDA